MLWYTEVATNRRLAMLKKKKTGLSEIGTYRGPNIMSTIPFHQRVHLCDQHQRLQKLLH
ncbi:hypothetical protein HanXRQr2_Chr03g0132321 [Helianthus annuus]|uniref:Uncharacterized protein n=1 Tax=Helianthus annuus TaxID=4232 RepID=A0A9K3JJM4_HELAN|nr:hypothetical protein HanXRQr2_Chr03g0132321 [Helianthus annuus]